MWGLKERRGVAKPVGGISEKKGKEEETSDWNAICELCDKDYKEEDSTAEDTAAYCSKKCEREANGDSPLDKPNEPYVVCPYCKARLSVKEDKDGDWYYLQTVDDQCGYNTLHICPTCKVIIQITK